MAAWVVVDDDATPMPLWVVEIAFHGSGRRKRASLIVVSQLLRSSRPTVRDGSLTMMTVLLHTAALQLA